MMIHEYAEALDNAVKFKESGKSFEKYEKEAQSKMQPIECQMMWVMAEYVMDKTAEVVNKETAELSKMLGEKDRKINKLKELVNKNYGAVNESNDFGFKAIGRVFVKLFEDHARYDGTTIDDVFEANTYDNTSSTVSGKGLITSVEKSERLGDWFIVRDLDTGSKKAYRLDSVQGYTELRYPMVTETSPIPEDPWKSWDPDKRVQPSIMEEDFND